MKVIATTWMERQRRTAARAHIAAGAASAIALVACGSDAGTPSQSTSATSLPESVSEMMASDATPVTEGNESTSSAAHAVATIVFGADGSQATYINVLTSLDEASLSFDQALEMADWSTIGAVGGKLLVASAEAPEVSSYEVATDGGLSKGETLSFAAHTTTVGVDPTQIISATKAYMTGDNQFIVWNPTTMLLEGMTVSWPELEQARGSLELFWGLERATVQRGQRLYQTAYWTDPDFIEFEPTSRIMVVDTDADQIASMLEAPCPNLDVATKDEQGNLYFSNWVFSIEQPLRSADAARNCYVRINAGEEDIDTSSVTYLSDLTEGREGAALRYLKDGKALLAVYHQERIDLGATDPGAVSGTDNWRFWIVDLEQRTAEIMPGIDWFGGGYNMFTLGGRFFLAVPDGEYSTTSVYEITDDFEAVPRFSTAGWVYQMIDIR